ncbi:hypothetical protein K504DRAFT_303285 [Pleomassaria siparia CBS 279.74]|uniref:Uncharacterized protein n=1 Tax=Pleomassaria siparia CBS 279.74 TaxID=1314801 RepID=A0A6G1K765_9PLEO|nr:hypothetical protein K504DRAFT_303285 [Pleomassaria siparia CBS 279.74]
MAGIGFGVIGCPFLLPSTFGYLGIWRNLYGISKGRDMGMDDVEKVKRLVGIWGYPDMISTSCHLTCLRRVPGEGFVPVWRCKAKSYASPCSTVLKKESGEASHYVEINISLGRIHADGDGERDVTNLVPIYGTVLWWSIPSLQEQRPRLGVCFDFTPSFLQLQHQRPPAI